MRQTSGQNIRQRGIQCDWAAVEMVKAQRDAASMADTTAIMGLINQNVGYQPAPTYQQPSGNFNALTGTTVQPNGAITQQGAGMLVNQYQLNNFKYSVYRNGMVEQQIPIAISQSCPMSN